MTIDLFAFQLEIDPTFVAGLALWALALYLAFAPVSDWLIDRLNQWMNFAERSLYTSAEEFERSRAAREAQNTFYASLLSIVPFLLVGGFVHYGVELTLGGSWGISLGILFAIGAGVYELGRRTGQTED
ncbi:MAG TPA: hypothetical protein IGS37_07580 [Synechococcales cyanobacterium M55_K2018_004]|nr:hypothetical protein [Synechococcales cyanobacterium M55_K2018_004]